MKRSLVTYGSMIALAVGALACSKSLTLDDGKPAALRGDPEHPDNAVDAGAQDAASPSGPVSHWAGNAADCPSGPIETGQACSVAEGSVCAYTWPDPEFSNQQLYNECTCRADCGEFAGETRWDCYGVSSGVQAPCPEEQPEDGSSCFGLRGNDCRYPVEVECSCRGDSKAAKWSCSPNAREPGVHPSGVDESTRVRDLSADQRDAWCAWLTQREPGFPPWPELEPDSDGFYPNTGCADTQYLSCAAHMPRDYAASACVANLELSSCEATLYELTECVLELGYKRTEHGCGHYIDVPGCAGTIVLPGRILGEPPDSCRLRVR